MNSENEEKKEYLRSYHYLQMEEKRISERLDELTSLIAGSAVQYSLLPKSNDPNHDLSDEIIKIDSEVERLYKKRSEAIDRYREIEQAIEELTDENEIAVLKYRYLDHMRWEDIAAKMSYGFRNVTKIHGRALYHFRIPDKENCS